MSELLGRLPHTESANPWLLAEGRELVIACAEGLHVFFGRVLVENGQLLDRRYLRTPDPLGELIWTTVDGDTLWLIGEAGHVLQVSWTTGEPVRWAHLAPFLTSNERIERAFLIPGGSHLWLEVCPPGGPTSDRVIEIEAWRVRREFPGSRFLRPLIAGSSSCVIGTGDRGAVRYTDRGAVAQDVAACAPLRVSTVAIDPDRDLVVLGSRSDDDDEDDAIEIARVKSGRLIRCQKLPDSSIDSTHRCASALGPGLLAVHHMVDRPQGRLMVFQFAGPELIPAHAVAAPLDLAFAQDVDATEVVCLWDSSRGLELATLGAQPPPFGDAIELRARWFIPTLGDYFSCGPADSAEGDTEVLSTAERAACLGDWGEVRALLEPVPLDSVAPRWIAHHCHLLGIAWLRTGAEAARVQEIWQYGHPREQAEGRLFTCRLDACLDLVEPLPDPLPEAWWSSEASILRQLRGAIATADKLLAAGEPEAALEVMRRRVVTGIHELQSAARLAAAWLASDPRDPGDRFDKAIALARFTALAARRTVDLPIEGAWSRGQLTQIAEAADRWLATWHERP